MRSRENPLGEILSESVRIEPSGSSFFGISNTTCAAVVFLFLIWFLVFCSIVTFFFPSKSNPFLKGEIYFFILKALDRESLFEIKGLI